MSLLVILAIFGSVQNILFSDSVRNWGEIRFISSKADFLTPEKIEQNWGRNTPVLYTNCCFKGLSEPISQLYKNLGFYIFLAVFLKTYHLQSNYLRDYRLFISRNCVVCLLEINKTCKYFLPSSIYIFIYMDMFIHIAKLSPSPNQVGLNSTIFTRPSISCSTISLNNQLGQYLHGHLAKLSSRWQGQPN